MRWTIEGCGGGGSAMKPEPVGEFMREVEKAETMDGGGRGNYENANNGCYGGTMLGRKRGE
jgi:hypothetical protein